MLEFQATGGKILDFSKYKAITFDCYGTVIDWETGILACLKPVFEKHEIQISDDEILEGYALIEPRLEENFQTYTGILRDLVKEFAKELNFKPDEEDINYIVDNFDRWVPFSDSTEALKKLQSKFKLGPLTNVDHKLFEISKSLIGVDFDYILTAEDIGSYKPDLQNFEYAIDYLAKLGIEKHEILHMAQSQFHDVVPANTIGLDVVWINRRKGKEGSGATKAAQGKPDLEAPDLKTFAELALRG